jgi:hypothetical protein
MSDTLRRDGTETPPSSVSDGLERRPSLPLESHLGARAGASRLDSEVITRRIEILRQEHRDLDAAIDALLSAPAIDQLQIARIKKRKLRLKDEISQLEDLLIPDIIA